MTMSRSQPAETHSNRSNCRIRSSGPGVQRSVCRLPREALERLFGMSKRMLLCIALDCDTLLKSTSESSDRENTYEFPPRKHHHCRRRTFPSHRTCDKSFQSIMKCDDDICTAVSCCNGTDALQGIGERMTKDQNAV